MAEAPPPIDRQADGAVALGPDFVMMPLRELAVIKVSIFPGEPSDPLRDAIGCPLPPSRRWIDLGDGNACATIAPTEWLLTGAASSLAPLVGRLRSAFSGVVALTTDLTDACAAFHLVGADAADRISASCPLDLRSETFPPGSAARSLIGEADLFIARQTDEGRAPAYLLIVDQTMASYAVRMIALP